MILCMLHIVYFTPISGNLMCELVLNIETESTVTAAACSPSDSFVLAYGTVLQ